MAEADTKRCSRCGVEKPRSGFFVASCCKDGLRGECKACVLEKNLAYRKANADKIAAQRKVKYDSEDKTQRQARNAAYYQANKERVKSRVRRWHSENRNLVSAKRKAMRAKLGAQALKYRRANLERVRATTKKWYAANKERLRPRRKAAKANRRAAGSVTAAVIRGLMDMQRGKCACCKISIRLKYHVDHITPIARGGTNDPANLQLLCPPCNYSKSAKDPIDFMQSRGFLL